ncbi:MAG: ABC transporter substrate-binding protein [Acidimicrobiales bacterium]
MQLRGDGESGGLSRFGVALVALVTAASSTAVFGAGAAAAATTPPISPASSLQCPAGTGTSAPGVTATTINVAGISTLTGSISAGFSGLVPGAEAYFDMIDAKGGVDGRKIKLAYNLNDGGTGTRFASLTHTAIDQDHAFATIVSSYWFSPTYFVSTCTPTYGYNVTGDWTKAPNLFAAGGSTQTYHTLIPGLTYLVKKEKIKTAGVLAYGVSSSSNACSTFVTGLKKNGVNVAYDDLKLTPLNPNVTPDVQRLKAAGADFIISCMTIGGNLSLARASKEYGLDAKMLWLTVPNQSVITKNSSLLQGVFFGEGNVPSAANTKYPGTYPGLAAYNAAIKKYEPSVAGDNIALQGWESAALLVAGIEAAGKNFTQASVVQATNRLTQFTAGGLYTPMNWEYTHTTVTEPYCEAFVQAQGTKLLPVLNTGKQVFVCFDKTPKHPTPVATRPGTPGPAVH